MRICSRPRKARCTTNFELPTGPMRVRTSSPCAILASAYCFAQHHHFEAPNKARGAASRDAGLSHQTLASLTVYSVPCAFPVNPALRWNRGPAMRPQSSAPSASAVGAGLFRARLIYLWESSGKRAKEHKVPKKRETKTSAPISPCTERKICCWLEMPDGAGYLVTNSYGPKPTHFANVHMGASDDAKSDIL